MKRSHQGFSLVSAVFLLVIVAALGAFMVTIGTTQRETSTLSVLGGRALAAAGSGMEWAVQRVLSDDACTAFPASFALSGGAAGGYAVAASCAAFPQVEGAAAYNVFRLTVTASRGNAGESGFVSRTIRATVATAP